MKFAKELEQEAVPEWRVKYLNYKAGKKYVKGVARAINRTHGTPRGFGRRTLYLPPHSTPSHYRPSPLSRNQNGSNELGFGALVGSVHSNARTTLPTKPIPVPARPEQQPLAKSPGNDANYGSIVPTPMARVESRNEFELPAPALRVPSHTDDHPPRPIDMLRRSLSHLAMRRSISLGGRISSDAQDETFPRSDTMSSNQPGSGRIRRMFSTGQQLSRTDNAKLGLGMQELDVVRLREREFFDFMDSELNKVETFYRQKEEQAGDRLNVLREQLHEMRNRRIQELAEMRHRKERGEEVNDNGTKGHSSGSDGRRGWIIEPIKSRIFKPGANSEAFANMAPTPLVRAMGGDARRDYVRKPDENDVPYYKAKRKLKLALQEFYRGLELLKSYALLNRTAFRKLNKKYDKSVNAQPPLRYLHEKVNKSWFVTSDIIDGQIRAVEDLYARYFEKGNHKIAAGKLRRLNRRPGDESGIAFRNGLFLGTGAVFTVQGLVYGAQLLFDSDPVVREQTSYLMQIYGGYFLMLFLFAMFCVDCHMWTTNKINYPFIFEFDPRSNLDWRQLASFPSFFLLLFGVFFWVNFTRYGTQYLYLYYPVILISISLVILLMPAPILFHKSRKWFAYSHFRLFFAGVYPVEFRDFFLGDIYCSLIYATCNVELFFCLYAHYWNDPHQCNSSNSRLLGFFATLPPIWRALQCLRRFYDTNNWFPHLVNCGKYTMTILAAVTLSLYRIEESHSNFGLFVTFSTINAIYCSIWDLFMDFSLLQPDSRYRFLRDILGLKRRWMYYAIMVIDPILRFGWIFYAIFTHDLQHNTIVSFLVSLAEVTRRGMWALFRVENEHCSNVAQYKASRDVPLPYDLGHEPLVARASADEPAKVSSATNGAGASLTKTASGVGVSEAGASQRGRERQYGTANAEPQQPEAPTPSLQETGMLRRRLTRGKSIRNIMADAHRQDFEKRRRPSSQGPVAAVGAADMNGRTDVDDVMSAPSDDEEDDDTASMLDERMEARQSEGLVRGESLEENED